MNESASYLARHQDVETAREFLQDVLRSKRYIADFPEGGKNEGDGVQSWKLKTFPYSIIYRVLNEETVRILAIAAHRKPLGFWREREEEV